MTTTTPARDPVVEIHPSHLRVVGVKLSDAELIVLRNIAARMKGDALSPSWGHLATSIYPDHPERQEDAFSQAAGASASGILPSKKEPTPC